jgi:hypothetical protein
VVGGLAAIVGFLVAGLSEYNFGDSEVVMVAWALMALPWVADAKDPRRSAGSKSDPLIPRLMGFVK